MPNDDQWMTTETSGRKSRIRSLEWLPIRPKRGSREEQTQSILGNTPLFQKIRQQDWKLLSNLFHERKFEQGEIIFEKGMPGLGMYIILEGDVKIVGDDSEGSPTFAELAQGDFFGEMAVIQEGVRNATAIAATPCVLIGIFRPQLRELLKDRPNLGVLLYERLARVMADRLRLADDLLLQAAKSSGDSEL
jgi:CRP/FNR family transcriptional regulator, cyclic AMP receptor protein